jgi:hypothetical protein
MITLDYPGQPPRVTDDAEIIATLARKGWAVRPDPPAHDPQTHTARWNGAQWVVEAIPIEQMQAQVGAAVQSMIDDVCTSGVPYFRDIFSARGYVGDPNPAYHARAVALRDWSSSVWTALDEIQADVMAGNRPLPALPELLAELPQLRCSFHQRFERAFAGVSQDVVLLLVESTEPSPAATSAATVPQGQMSLL